MTDKDSPRKPAYELMADWLKKHKISFFIRRQQVRYLDDNGIIIEPPKAVVFYNDEYKKEDIPEPKKESN